MATISSCKYATDVAILADYLKLKSQDQDVTLELSATNEFYILDWGSGLSCITQFVINFFIRLQQEGLAYYLTAPLVPLAERKVAVLSQGLEIMINSYDAWLQHIWLENQPRPIREPHLEKMESKQRLDHFAFYSCHLTQKAQEENDERKAIYTQLLGFRIVSKAVEEMPPDYQTLLKADFPSDSPLPAQIIQQIGTCTGRSQAVLDVLKACFSPNVPPETLLKLSRAVKGEAITLAGDALKVERTATATSEGPPGLVFKKRQPADNDGRIMRDKGTMGAINEEPPDQDFEDDDGGTMKFDPTAVGKTPAGLQQEES